MYFLFFAHNSTVIRRPIFVVNSLERLASQLAVN
jgi:hypothetical protein